jgi:cytochrome b
VSIRFFSAFQSLSGGRVLGGISSIFGANWYTNHLTIKIDQSLLGSVDEVSTEIILGREYVKVTACAQGEEDFRKNISTVAITAYSESQSKVLKTSCELVLYKV